MSYLTMMAHRIYYMHKVLKDTGSFYLHCDPTMSHYLKILLDIIFGQKNFKREIIWSLKTVSGYKSQVNGWVRGHDTILYYTKSDNFTFNKQYIPHNQDYISRFRKVDENGRKYRDDRSDGRKQYLDETKGVMLSDTWDDIMSFQQNSTSKERLGYPTQKPEALLERIIKASSNEGDLVADFFCGCGTTITVAEKLKRQWLGVDINHLAISLIEEKRLIPLGAKYTVEGFPKDIASAEKLALDDKFKFEEWVVEYLLQGHKTKSTGDGGIDGHVAYTLPNGEKIRTVIEVKGGGVTINQIRAFKDSISKFNADFGIFVAFEKLGSKNNITNGMKEEANKLGNVDNVGVFKLNKMYILTIEDLFNKNLPDSLRVFNLNTTY